MGMAPHGAGAMEILMKKRQPPKRHKPGIDRGQNTIYNTIYKNLLTATGIRNDQITEWVKEAGLPYTKSLVMGWRMSPDKPTRYRLMRLEELMLMSELVRRKQKGLPVDGLGEQVTLKGYFKPEAGTDGGD